MAQHQATLSGAQRQPTHALETEEPVVPAQSRTEQGNAEQPESPSAAAAPRAAAGFSRLPSLTGLRWLAAFIVFGYHIGTLGVIHRPPSPPNTPPNPGGHLLRSWEAVFGQGDIGVAFFFVLSGFVLTWVAKPGDTRTAFWRRRVAKIYPNHALTWAIVLGIGLFLGDKVSKVVALLNLALVQPWFYGSFHGSGIGYSVNTVSWSLGDEMFFYLAFPFVIPYLRKLDVNQLYWTAFLLIGLTYCLQQWQFYVFPHDPVRSYWFTYMFPPVRSIEFWLGVITALLVKRGRWHGPSLWIATVFAVGVYYLNGTDWIPLNLHTIYFDVACCILIAAAARADLSGVWSPWRWRPLVFLGEVSFAFYLVHVALIQNIMRRWHPEGWHGATSLLVVAGLLGAAIGLAYLLYRFVEMPAMRLLRPKKA